MILEIFLTIAAVATLAEIWRHHRRLRRTAATQTPREPLSSYPSVTVIRPIKGLDAGAAGNIRAALRHGYPGDVQTLFVLDDENDPAVPLARQAVEAHRAAGGASEARVLICGAPPAQRTGKLHAMIAGLGEANGEVVVFADSDIRPGREALSALIETLRRSPGAGASFAPVVVTSPLRTAGDAGYALLLNGMYGPAAADSARRNGGDLPFIMGQFMAWRREAIEAIGGLECAEGQLVDDMYLGQRLSEAGFRNVVSPRPVPIIQEGLGLRDFLGVYRRWVAFSRTGLPDVAFKKNCHARLAMFYVAAAIAAVSAAASLWPATAVAGIATVASLWSVNRMHRVLGGAPVTPRFAWAALALLLLGPFIMLSVRVQPEINWRGRKYRLDARSRLAASTRQ